MSQWQSAAWRPNEHKTAGFTPNRMKAWNFFGLAASHSFERTTLGLLAEERRIAEAEHEAGTDWDPVEQLGGYDAVSYDLSDLQTSHPHAMTEEAFKAAGFDRGGRIEWTPLTTRQRAEIEAETFDRREWEKKLLALNSDTLGRKALGFGAAFLANIPDPVNLVPVFGSAAKGATLGARVLRGAAEGLATTGLTDAARLPAAARRGDDIDFADLALDLTFGGLFGAGFGAASGLMHNRRAAGLSGQQTRLAELLGEAGYESADAERLAASAIAHIADMPRRMELSENVRRNMAGMDRLGAGKLLDRMMLAIRDGENPDVGKWATELRLLPTISRIERDRLIQVLESGEFENVTFGRLSPDKKEALNAIRAEEGESLLVGDQLVIPANVVKKFHEKRILLDGHTPDDVAQMLLDVFHLEPDAISSTRYPHIQALVKLRDELSTLGFIAQNPKTGETVIKSVYRKETKKIVKDLALSGGEKREKDSGWGGAESPIGVGNELPLAAPRLSDLQPESYETNIPTPRSTVNIAEFHPDFTAPAPEPEIVPLSLEEAARAEAVMFNANEFGTLDREVAHVVGEGRMKPEGMAEPERVDTMKNTGPIVPERRGAE